MFGSIKKRLIRICIAEQTVSNLQQAASSVEELNAAVRQTTDSARTADQLASSSASTAAKGGTVVSPAGGRPVPPVRRGRASSLQPSATHGAGARVQTCGERRRQSQARLGGLTISPLAAPNDGDWESFWLPLQALCPESA